MLLVLVPDWDPVLILSLHCAVDLRGPDWRGVRSCITDRWFIWVNLSLTGGKCGVGGGRKDIEEDGRRNEVAKPLPRFDS